MQSSEVVRYAPDKDAAFGHALRPARPGKAWAAVRRFLLESAEKCSTSQVRLVAYRATAWDSPGVAERCIAAVQERFGPPTLSAAGGVSVPSGAPIPGGYLEWRSSGSALEDFTAFIIAGEPWPKTTVGPVAAMATFRFLWRDPDGIGPLKEQLTGHLTPDGTLWSELSISLQRSSFVQPELWFPFASGDPRLINMVQLIAPLLPFKLSAKHFRVAVPVKAATGYKLRRFDAHRLLAA